MAKKNINDSKRNVQISDRSSKRLPKRKLVGGPHEFSSEYQDGVYVLCFCGEPVRTPQGKIVVHPHELFISQIMSEMDGHVKIEVVDGIIVKPRILGSYTLYSTQKDGFEDRNPISLADFTCILKQDGILYRCAGPEVVDQLFRWTPAIDYLGYLGLHLPVLTSSFGEEDCDGEEKEESSDPTNGFFPKFVSSLYASFSSLTPAQQASVVNLHHVHGGVLLFPLVLVQRKCSPTDYARGVLACHTAIGGVFDVSSRVHEKSFQGLLADARTVLEFLEKAEMADILPPDEIKESLARFRVDYPDKNKVAFIMMKFGQTGQHEKIVKGIKAVLEPHGITGLRADDKQYHDDLFGNILTYLFGCGIGIAVFERIESDEFNPNVSLEVGYMMAMRRPVCLLKDKTLRSLPSDLVGRLYKPFDPQDPMKSILPVLRQWLSDKGLA